MRAEEFDDVGNVIAFRRTWPTEPQPDGELGVVPGAVDEPAVALAPAPAPGLAPVPAFVLNAERGIINTGIVHGGQHITTVERSAHLIPGADGDV